MEMMKEAAAWERTAKKKSHSEARAKREKNDE
jgi:hypothetical protein